MKKRFVMLGIVALLVVGTVIPSAFAANSLDNSWYNQMFDWHDQWIDQSIENGQIDPNQAQAWQGHFDYMRDFHGQNGFGPMGGMMGGYSTNSDNYGYGSMMGSY
ncbi:MAG: hypothetical protein FH758_08295 [Firmicutes bacterium]|nr:hypothetical protein [Bacillota bacterium]